MTAPTPRDVAPDDIQRLQAVEDAMAAIGDLEELPIDDVLTNLETVHHALTEALNPEEQQQKFGTGTKQ